MILPVQEGRDSKDKGHPSKTFCFQLPGAPHQEMNRDVLLYRETTRQGETEKTNRDRDRETMSLRQPLTQVPGIQGFWFPTPPKKVWVRQMLTTSKTREANISVALCFIIFSLYFLFKIKLGFILWSRLR